MKPILVILPFHSGDFQLALGLLEWIRDLGGHRGTHELLILGGHRSLNVEMLRLKGAALSTFISVVTDRAPGIPDESWPKGANIMFRHACELVQKRHKMPFLWMEPDCVPMKSGWLDAIATEYENCGHPFMGGIRRQTSNPNLPETYLPGCSMYPADAFSRLRQHWEPLSSAWDVSTAAVTVPNAVKSFLFYEWWGMNGKPPIFKIGRRATDPPEVMVPDQIPKEAVFFHRSKDGSLIRCLRELVLHEQPKPPVSITRSQPPTPVSIVTHGSPITVVITNCQRPDKLIAAFDSCLAAKVENIVVSSSRADTSMEPAFEHIRSRHPATIITQRPDDAGCNETWLRGVLAAKTEWVNILHDDDLLLTDFSVVEHLIPKHPSAGFFHWDARRHGNGDPGIQETLIGGQTGIHHTDYLWPRLLHSGGLSLSPVSGLFRRSHLVSVLEECERELKGSSYHIRPTMMVGNDLLIWLRAVESCKFFYYSKTPFVSYGGWDGSVTFHECHQRVNRLPPIYAAARAYYLLGPNRVSERPFIHVRTGFGKGEPRSDFAHSLWNREYKKAKWKLKLIDESAMPRMFSDNRRKIPFLKDMIEWALSGEPDDAIFVFTNSDTNPIEGFTRILSQAMETHEAAYSYRRDTKDLRVFTPSEIRLVTQPYCGLDMFAFTKAWWRKYCHQLPDVVFATEIWDYVLQLLMLANGGKPFFYLIYHQAHQGIWSTLLNAKSTVHNRAVSKQFILDHGGIAYWEMPLEEACKILYVR